MSALQKWIDNARSTSPADNAAKGPKLPPTSDKRPKTPKWNEWIVPRQPADETRVNKAPKTVMPDAPPSPYTRIEALNPVQAAASKARAWLSKPAVQAARMVNPAADVAAAAMDIPLSGISHGAKTLPGTMGSLALAALPGAIPAGALEKWLKWGGHYFPTTPAQRKVFGEPWQTTLKEIDEVAKRSPLLTRTAEEHARILESAGLKTTAEQFEKFMQGSRFQKPLLHGTFEPNIEAWDFAKSQDIGPHAGTVGQAHSRLNHLGSNIARSPEMAGRYTSVTDDARGMNMIPVWAGGKTLVTPDLGSWKPFLFEDAAKHGQLGLKQEDANSFLSLLKWMDGRSPTHPIRGNTPPGPEFKWPDSPKAFPGDPEFDDYLKQVDKYRRATGGEMVGLFRQMGFGNMMYDNAAEGAGKTAIGLHPGSLKGLFSSGFNFDDPRVVEPFSLLR